jgi:hypothetical protein
VASEEKQLSFEPATLAFIRKVVTGIMASGELD